MNRNEEDIRKMSKQVFTKNDLIKLSRHSPKTQMKWRVNKYRWTTTESGRQMDTLDLRWSERLYHLFGCVKLDEA